MSGNLLNLRLSGQRPGRKFGNNFCHDFPRR
jgi:hypothetical protein